MSSYWQMNLRCYGATIGLSIMSYLLLQVALITTPFAQSTGGVPIVRHASMTKYRAARHIRKGRISIRAQYHSGPDEHQEGRDATTYTSPSQGPLLTHEHGPTPIPGAAADDLPTLPRHVPQVRQENCTALMGVALNICVSRQSPAHESSHEPTTEGAPQQKPLTGYSKIQKRLLKVSIRQQPQRKPIQTSTKD